MDKRQAQARGAKLHGQPEAVADPGDGYDVEVRVMHAHGWRTGHRVCDCEVLMGGSNINASVLPGHAVA